MKSLRVFLRNYALRSSFLIFLALWLACAPSWGSEKDAVIERGRPVYLLDSVGNALSTPQKVVLLNSKIDNHSVSSPTEQTLRAFLDENGEEMKDVKIRINQCDPWGELGRLTKNHRISWWWRIFPGAPVTLWSSLTGRLLGGDNYNPYTNTISLYSDSPVVALHEAGHAKDFARREPGFDSDVYALGRVLPPVALYQEYEATDEAIQHLREKRGAEGEREGYRTLYPAYGTYGGAYSGIPYGQVAGAAVGHGVAWWKIREQNLYKDSVRDGEAPKGFEADPLAKAVTQSESGDNDTLYRGLNRTGQIRWD